MTDTVRDIISEALLDLGVLPEGDTPTAIQAAGALKKFNGMLDLMGLDPQLVYGMNENILPLVSNKGMYTIGAGGDLDIPRPNRILNVAIRDTTLPAAQRADYPVLIYNNEEWAEVVFKQETAQWPSFGIYFDYKYPYIEAYTNPVPNSSQYSIVIFTEAVFAALTLDSTLIFPAGYRTLLVTELAIILSSSYSIEIPQAILAQNIKAKKLIENANLQINELKTYLGASRYNINTNRYTR